MNLSKDFLSFPETTLVIMIAFHLESLFGVVWKHRSNDYKFSVSQGHQEVTLVCQDVNALYGQVQGHSAEPLVGEQVPENQVPILVSGQKEIFDGN